MDQTQARIVARQIRLANPTTTYTDIAYGYSHGTYVVIVYSQGDIVALVDADAAAFYLLNHPSVGSD